ERGPGDEGTAALLTTAAMRSASPRVIFRESRRYARSPLWSGNGTSISGSCPSREGRMQLGQTIDCHHVSLIFSAEALTGFIASPRDANTSASISAASSEVSTTPFG